MKRRDLLKNIALTSVGVATAATGLNASPTKESDLEAGKKKKKKAAPGRTPEEVERDAKLMAETFFTPHEMATITVICDIILPADATSGSASQAGVPAFIEFMAKDMPQQQTPLRGGMMWIDNQAMKRFGKKFVACTAAERIQIVDDIAYPEQAKPAMKQGVAFFNLMRDLTMTGFYTTEMGFQDLGYVGNQPNTWLGVPEEVLKQYGLTGQE
ncbi:gluconate 2-dehydrogenase subunit 3 family protein [Haliscomenobacter sp.]|uniref:gluconate 2-dehydrogenase subunit 3 family protein n=1 Tax=Haliscomenobacter sp. TaxID=2717303 RepID=UPI003592F58E